MEGQGKQRQLRLKDHEQCSQLGKDILVKINERNKHNRTSKPYTQLSAQVRSSMKQFSGDVQKLRNGLIRATSSYHITQREVERRQHLVDDLTTREKQIEQAFKNEGGETSTQREVERRQHLVDDLTTREKQIEQAFKNEGGETRYNLMAGGSSQSDPWGVQEEPEQYRDMANSQIRMQQNVIIIEQDRGLEALSNVIARQKNMALDIGNEVDTQNEMLDDIIDHTDRTGERLIKETRHVRIVDRKTGTCCYWVVIVLLFIAIIVIIVVPYNGKGA